VLQIIFKIGIILFLLGERMRYSVWATSVHVFFWRKYIYITYSFEDAAT
jgi:hypothetical protein